MKTLSGTIAMDKKGIIGSAKEIRGTAKEAIGKAIWAAAKVSTVRVWRT